MNNSSLVGGFDVSTFMRILQEKQDKSKPAQVFLNHFSALCFHIENDSQAKNLNTVRYFYEIKEGSCKCDYDTLRKLLYNCWSTEYALRLTANQDNNDFLGFAVQWALPQAYYSSYQSLNAFIQSTGATTSSHTGAIKKFAELVKNNKYPKTISFYCDGDYSDLKVVNIPSKGVKSSSLSRIYTPEDAQGQIAMLLRGTRKELAEQLKKDRQCSSKPILTKDKKVAKAFSCKQWAEIIKPSTMTTLFDFLYRLRLKANYSDVQMLIEAEIDFVEFHSCIHKIVSYINFIHEAYIAKSIGYKKFNELVINFPKHPVLEPIVLNRWQREISPLLGVEWSDCKAA
ncbi:hypothetical protein [Hymenobacter profundi]|uniref:Uncharacterized protein n=1 Tax=Hymenobacter profundi TaxID=1982110 RepID=A0ABS6X6U0_9BACT|nr:hypothetical protein [Hymenobacter profundi]MBW3131177.1 hypothetical protein [Hymenobacter profundi]